MRLTSDLPFRLILDFVMFALPREGKVALKYEFWKLHLTERGGDGTQMNRDKMQVKNTLNYQ